MKKILCALLSLSILTGCAPVLSPEAIQNMEKFHADEAKVAADAMTVNLSSCQGLSVAAQAACVTGAYMARQAEILTRDKTNGYTYALAADKMRNEAVTSVLKGFEDAAVKMTGIGVAAWTAKTVLNHPTQTVQVVQPDVVQPAIVEVPAAAP